MIDLDALQLRLGEPTPDGEDWLSAECRALIAEVRALRAQVRGWGEAKDAIAGYERQIAEYVRHFGALDAGGEAR